MRKSTEKKEKTQLQGLKEELIKMLEVQQEYEEESIKFVISQVKIIAHNLLFRIYSNAVLINLIRPPEPKNSISELIKKVCFTTQSNMVQIFMSDYNLANILAVNFEEILKESDTKDKSYEVVVSEEVEGAVIDIVLNKSRIESFVDYSKDKEVYSV
jgi:hypothetical protein